MDSVKTEPLKKQRQKLPSKSSTRKSIRFSTSKSIPSHSFQQDTISEEVDIDERVIRSTTNRQMLIEQPCSISVENSRIFDLLQTEFPYELAKDVDWPDFDTMTPGNCIQYLGEIMACENHEENMASFWLLDTLSEVIRQGQLKQVTNENLSTICIWFGCLFKIISVYAPSREDFFISVNDMLFAAEEEYLETGSILHPKDIKERLELKKDQLKDARLEGRISLPELLAAFEKIDIVSESQNSSLSEAQETKQSQSSDNGSGDAQITLDFIESEPSEECEKLNELAFLTEHLFKVFGNRFKYEVIKTVFSNPPEIRPIIIVENMNFPKETVISQRQKMEIIAKKKDLPKKNAKAAAANKKKETRKNVKTAKEPENLVLERFKNELEEIDKEREEEKEKERTRDFYIKPIEDSVDPEFFERLFPKPEIEIPVVQKPKEKPGKNKKKK